MRYKWGIMHSTCAWL